MKCEINVYFCFDFQLNSLNFVSMPIYLLYLFIIFLNVRILYDFTIHPLFKSVNYYLNLLNVRVRVQYDGGSPAVTPHTMKVIVHTVKRLG